MHQKRRRPLVLALALVVAVSAVLVAVAAAGTSKQTATKIKVGLITKDVTNPFFVKMRQGATAQAKKLGAQLSYAAGKNSSDNASQIAAIENMTTAGVKGILITVADAKAENAAIKKARRAGVLVIALDSPTNPTTAVDALFATNNFNAGVLIGRYARAATRGRTVTIGMLDEHSGSSVGKLRQDGKNCRWGIYHAVSSGGAAFPLTIPPVPFPTVAARIVGTIAGTPTLRRARSRAALSSCSGTCRQRPGGGR